jgi:hypothetical protein
VLEAGSLGDYAQARGALREIRGGLRTGHERLKQELQRLKVVSLAMFPALLSGPPSYLPAAFCFQFLGRMGQERAELEKGEPVLLTQQADLCVLEALLALELGAPEPARLAFAEAQRLCAPPAGPPFAFGGGPIAGAYLPLLNARYRR